jgi:lipopolysaccharide transport system permease protein
MVVTRAQVLFSTRARREIALYSPPRQHVVHPDVNASASKSFARHLNPWLISRNLWSHRNLVWQFTLRNIEMRHKGSHLGLVWSVLKPLIMLGLYTLVFGYVFKGKFGVHPHESHSEFALGVFIGLSLIQMLSEVIGTSPMTVASQPNFVKKVVFPLEILPVTAVGASIVHFLISMVLVAIGVVLIGPGLSWSALWMPVIVLPVIFLALGLGWLISALGVFLRDIGQITEFLSVVLMYASVVFFPPSKVPPQVWVWLRLNPVALAVDLSRDSLLWRLPLNGTHLLYLYACGIATFLVGYAVFARLKPAFADVV